ncbi:Mbeg1-like protein [Oribacterium parvum]|uniref:Mbeg1-like protein n=1 Tax=Oribacterium parvum TaxID=1501329 RepID=UPI0028DB0C6B|nr:Mbeg1-like protein [Oribacterium parvum]
MELLDYLAWRNDVPLSISPFNEVDNVIFSYLSYIDFRDLKEDWNGFFDLRDLFRDFCEKYSLEEIMTTGEFTERAPLLLKKMMEGERFSDTKVGYYAEDFDKDKVKQFAALVFLLPDGRNYISFRGTDKTITGWKEDFLMSCQSETAGAKEAVAYFNKIAPVLEGELILGGHSKGGNFAMYAAAFCEAEYKERIVQVYNNDGPGFREEVIQTPEFQEILPKISTIAPQSSIIGQLLSNPAKQHVIHSTAKGILQHDAMTWEAEKDTLVSSELDELSEYTKTTLGSWLESMDDETRESLCTTAFSLIESTKSETFIEFSGNLMKNMETIWKEMGKLPEEKKKEIMNALSNLMESSKQAAVSQIKSGGQTVISQIQSSGQALLSQMQTGSHAAISQVMGKTKEEGEKV